jgi:hypothetical protein
MNVRGKMLTIGKEVHRINYLLLAEEQNGVISLRDSVIYSVVQRFPSYEW